jgi:hypothetical protein
MQDSNSSHTNESMHQNLENACAEPSSLILWPSFICTTLCTEIGARSENHLQKTKNTWDIVLRRATLCQRQHHIKDLSKRWPHIVQHTRTLCLLMSLRIFNSIYHHDLVGRPANADASESDMNSLSTYFRQINSGRSVDLWPPGLYFAKFVVNDFLRFVEPHYAIKSAAFVQFMGDIAFFPTTQMHWLRIST